MSERVKPGARLRYESSKAYAAFCLYRDQGQARSHVSVVAELGKPKGYIGQIESWSRKYRWVERATQWDDHLDSLRRKRAERAAMKDAELIVRVARAMLERSLEALEAGAMSEKDVVRAGEAGAKLMRLVLGDATERIETRETMDIARYREIAAKLEAERKAAGEGETDG